MTTQTTAETPSAARVFADGAGARTALDTTVPNSSARREAAVEAVAKIDRIMAWVDGGLPERVAQFCEQGQRRYEFFKDAKSLAEMFRDEGNIVRELRAERDRVSADIDEFKAAKVREAETAAAGERKKILQEAREEAKTIVEGGRVIRAELDRANEERRAELAKLEAAIHRTRMERDRLVNALRYGVETDKPAAVQS